MGEHMYGRKEQERLFATEWHESVDEAVNDGCSFPIKIYEFKRVEVFGHEYYKNFLEYLLEDLDQEHADPDGDYTKPTPRMTEASKAFIDVMREEYQPSQNEKTGVYRIYSNTAYEEFKEGGTGE